MILHDQFQRFLFEDVGIRGGVVRLDRSWRNLLAQHEYPIAVRDQLGQALAAVLLLASTIKLEGSLILQVQGDGPLHTLVAQATDARCFRGLAHWRGDVPEGSLSEVFGVGRLVLTIQTEGAEPYQGIVPLEGLNLTSAIEAYFEQSEQLATRLWLAADACAAAGLFLQQLPEQFHEPLEWDRLTTSWVARIKAPGLLSVAGHPLLDQLFSRESVRLSAPEIVRFQCSCSRERIEKMLAAMGNPTLSSLVVDQDPIDVRCEFCNRLYRFEQLTAVTLLSARQITSGAIRNH